MPHASASLGRERTRRHRCGADRLLRHRGAAALAARAQGVRGRSAPRPLAHEPDPGLRRNRDLRRLRHRRRRGDRDRPGRDPERDADGGRRRAGSSSRSACSTTSSTCIRSAKLGAQLVAALPRPPQHDLGRVRLEPDARAGRSGSSGSSASRTRSTCSTTWTGSRASLGVVAAACFALSAAFVDPNRDIFIIATALALALLGFIPYNLRLNGPARVFMGDSGSQLIGFVLASLGLMASYKEAGDDDRHGGAAGADPRGPDPRHDARDGAAPALGAVGDRRAARDHTSHRLVYRGLSERRAVAVPRRRLGRARSDEPRLRRARQRPHHDDRRARHVRAAAPVRRVPLRRRGRRRARAGSRTAPACSSTRWSTARSPWRRSTPRT